MGGGVKGVGEQSPAPVSVNTGVVGDVCRIFHSRDSSVGAEPGFRDGRAAGARCHFGFL